MNALKLSFLLGFGLVAFNVAAFPKSLFNIEDVEELVNFEDASDYLNYIFNGYLPSYRLPNNSIPLRYDLWVKTNIHKRIHDFSAIVKIKVKITEPTKTITLHMSELDIKKIDLVSVNCSLNKTQLKYSLNAKFNFLIISLPRKFIVDEEIILSIQYSGELNPNSIAFYPGSYENEKNETIWYAATKFEPTFARYALPCYDEPAIRAVINVQIQHHKTYSAVSNMPIVSRDEIGINFVTSKFADTPPIQIYLLAFVVSDFKFISNNDTKVEQRIYANAQSIENGEAVLALSVVGLVVEELEKVFGVKFPLTKVDHIAVSVHVSNAMENFGAIIYRESSLLYGPRESFEENYEQKVFVTRVIAHELVHQYFGNLVAPKWWSYLWLSEGFASFYQFYILSQIYPDEFYIDGMQVPNEVFLEDDFRQESLNLQAETTTEIRQKFNLIFYQKGAAIIRMFHEALTAKTFTKGLKYYLTAMSFSAATPDDLHRELQRAFDEDFPGNCVDLGSVMKTWEDQAGFPVVHVKKSGDKFILTQSKLGGGNGTFEIPISYALKSDGFSNDSSAKLWMTTKSVEIEACNDDWILLNVGNTGYFKVNYTSSILDAFIETFLNNRTDVPASNKAAILDSFVTVLLEENLPLPRVLKIFHLMEHETDYSVWKVLEHFVIHCLKLLSETKAEKKFQKFVQLLIKPQLDNLGLKSLEDEPIKVFDSRKFFVRMSCEAKQDDCLQFEMEKLKKSVDANKTISNFCLGVKILDEKTSLQLLTQLKEDKNLIYSFDFTCLLDKMLLKTYLNTSFSIFESEDFLTELSYTMKASTEGLDVGLDFMLENFEEIAKMLRINDEMNFFDGQTLTFIHSKHHVKKLKTILKKLEVELKLSGDFYSEVYTKIENNQIWMKTNLDGIDEWLDKELQIMTNIA